MIIALTACGTFALGFLIHWIWWRVRIPRRQSAALLLVLLASWPLGTAVVWFVPAWHTRFPWNAWALLHTAEFHVACSLAYIVAYSALEARSPSMTLLTFVAEARQTGRTHEELHAALAGMTPLEARLAAMQRDRMLIVVAESYRVTPKGRAWAATFGRWRRWIGLQKGG